MRHGASLATAVASSLLWCPYGTCFLVVYANYYSVKLTVSVSIYDSAIRVLTSHSSINGYG